MNQLCSWLTLNGASCHELAGSLLLALNVYLVTRQNIWSWPVGIAGCAFYVIVFLHAGLYSDTGLQVVYIVLAIYGWYHWLRGGVNRTELQVSRASTNEALILLAIGAAGWMVLYNITSRLPGTKLPLLDSALVAASLVAQYMMTRKIVESWIVWIIVDLTYVGMFYQRNLVLTAILYAVFFLLAVSGYHQWKKTYLQNLSASS